jgi:hypothetical protein
MVVIMGWGAGNAQDLGEVAPVACPNCHNAVFFHHIRSDKKISLYFIPLVPYGSNERLSCPICHSGIKLKPEWRAKVDAMRAATAQYRRHTIADGEYQGRVAQFWRSLGVDPAGTQVRAPRTIQVPVAAAQQAVAAAGPSLTDRLASLASLKEAGVLTDDEFAAAKRKILEI